MSTRSKFVGGLSKRQLILRAAKNPEITNIMDAAAVGCESEFVDQLREPTPTSAPGGSQQKLDVLAARAANGEHLWSEGDGDTYEDTDYEPTSSSAARR